INGVMHLIKELNATIVSQEFDNVCSPGGTTIAAVRALEERGFRSAVMEAVMTAAEKSQEMSKK
ncbi:MAG: pyrroline-5-carboxylate reductase dimerization domain-containing protein, partial [Anaeroglobus sp.]